MQQPTRLPSASPIEEARAQAEAYDSLFSSKPLELPNGDVLMVPPHPDFGLLDDEQMEAYEDLQMEVETYDRAEDYVIPRQVYKDEHGAETVIAEETRKGAILTPYRKNGERVRPSHRIRVVQAALGPEAYQKLRNGGGNAKDVWKIWAKQGMEIQERRLADSKSDRGSVDLESVSEADRK